MNWFRKGLCLRPRCEEGHAVAVAVAVAVAGDGGAVNDLKRVSFGYFVIK